MILLWMLPNVSRVGRSDLLHPIYWSRLHICFAGQWIAWGICLKAATIFSAESRRILHDVCRETDQKGRKL